MAKKQIADVVETVLLLPVLLSERLVSLATLLAEYTESGLQQRKVKDANELKRLKESVRDGWNQNSAIITDDAKRYYNHTRLGLLAELVKENAINAAEYMVIIREYKAQNDADRHTLLQLASNNVSVCQKITVSQHLRECILAIKSSNSWPKLATLGAKLATGIAAKYNISEASGSHEKRDLVTALLRVQFTRNVDVIALLDASDSETVQQNYKDGEKTRKVAGRLNEMLDGKAGTKDSAPTPAATTKEIEQFLTSEVFVMRDKSKNGTTAAKVKDLKDNSNTDFDRQTASELLEGRVPVRSPDVIAILDIVANGTDAQKKLLADCARAISQNKTITIQ